MVKTIESKDIIEMNLQSLINFCKENGFNRLFEIFKEVKNSPPVIPNYVFKDDSLGMTDEERESFNELELRRCEKADKDTEKILTSIPIICIETIANTFNRDKESVQLLYEISEGCISDYEDDYLGKRVDFIENILNILN